MKFQSDHSNTPLVGSFDGHSIRLRLPTGELHSHTGSLLLHAKSGQVQAWAPRSFAALQAQDFAAIAALAPQVVIFGSGEKLRFVPPQFSTSLMAARIGMETMDNHAACRTFNVLSAEGRDVLLALLLEDESPAA
jgi:uncharacterized protein